MSSKEKGKKGKQKRGRESVGNQSHGGDQRGSQARPVLIPSDDSGSRPSSRGTEAPSHPAPHSGHPNQVGGRSFPAAIPVSQPGVPMAIGNILGDIHQSSSSSISAHATPHGRHLGQGEGRAPPAATPVSRADVPMALGNILGNTHQSSSSSIRAHPGSTGHQGSAHSSQPPRRMSIGSMMNNTQEPELSLVSTTRSLSMADNPAYDNRGNLQPEANEGSPEPVQYYSTRKCIRCGKKGMKCGMQLPACDNCLLSNTSCINYGEKVTTPRPACRTCNEIGKDKECDRARPKCNVCISSKSRCRQMLSTPKKPKEEGNAGKHVTQRCTGCTLRKEGCSRDYPTCLECKQHRTGCEYKNPVLFVEDSYQFQGQVRKKSKPSTATQPGGRIEPGRLENTDDNPIGRFDRPVQHPNDNPYVYPVPQDAVIDPGVDRERVVGWDRQRATLVMAPEGEVLGAELGQNAYGEWAYRLDSNNEATSGGMGATSAGPSGGGGRHGAGEGFGSGSGSGSGNKPKRGPDDEGRRSAGGKQRRQH